MKMGESRSKLIWTTIITALLLTVSIFNSSVFSQPQSNSERMNRIGALLMAKQRGIISAKPDPQFVTRGKIFQGSMERTYALLVPPRIAVKGNKVPLVLVLHGGGGNAQNAMRVSGFNEKALKEGFIVAYPEGTGRSKDALLTWNAGHCCGSAMIKKIDDVGFIRKLIDKLENDYPVDPKRIYVTGMSNGGMMTHKIGIELSDRIAAICPIVATLFGDEKKPVNPVATIIFNGLLDESVPYQGGTHRGLFANAWDPNVPPLKVIEQAHFWAKANGCKTAPQIFEDAKLRHYLYKCPAGRNVEMYVIKDQGHAWPGGRRGTSESAIPSEALSATDVMWKFFKSQSR